jgi:hypothetical protein
MPPHSRHGAADVIPMPITWSSFMIRKVICCVVPLVAVAVVGVNLYGAPSAALPLQNVQMVKSSQVAQLAPQQLPPNRTVVVTKVNLVTRVNLVNRVDLVNRVNLVNRVVVPTRVDLVPNIRVQPTCPTMIPLDRLRLQQQQFVK